MYLGVCIIHEVKYVHIPLVSTLGHVVSTYFSLYQWLTGKGALYLFGMCNIYVKNPTSSTIYFLSSTPTLKT